MLAANIKWLRQLHPGVEITAISRDPEWTSAHYGVSAVPLLGFEPSHDRQQALWDQLFPSGQLNVPGPAPHVTAAIAGADAVIISGGGNLCSRWAHHIYDRTALIRIAYLLGKPVIVLGQTFGPHFEPDDRGLLASHLRLASLAGAREADSLRFLGSLDLDPAQVLDQLDDAWFLDSKPSQLALQAAARRSRDYIAVTLAPLSGDPADYQPVLRSLGRQLSQIVKETNTDLVFLPHWNALPGTESDSLMAQRLFGFLDEPERATLLPVFTAEDVCWLTQRASLVISTRYHPVVFGLSGRVPCLAIFTDEYTRIRQTGALRHAGVEDFALSFDDAVSNGLTTMALAIWNRRQEITARLHACETRWLEMEIGKWRRVAEALRWQVTSDAFSPRRTCRECAVDASVLQPAIPAPDDRTRKHYRHSARVSAVVLTRNGAGRLERCLRSIREADSPMNWSYVWTR